MRERVLAEGSAGGNDGRRIIGGRKDRGLGRGGKEELEKAKGNNKEYTK